MAAIFDFDHVHPRPPRELRALLGGKGANLAEMTTVLGLPVPHGFTISTEACRAYLASGWPDSLSAELGEHLRRLEEQMGRRLGAASDPLLVSVRSGAEHSMPGMMDTVLNLGLNDASVAGLAGQTGDERFAYDSYRRFIQMYGRIVLGLDGEPFDARSRRPRSPRAPWPTRRSRGGPRRGRRRLQGDNQPGHGRRLPRGARRRSCAARSRRCSVRGTGHGPSAYRKREGIPHDLGTAVNVQAMVFGNRDDRSGTGVGVHPRPGDRGEPPLRGFPGQRPGRGRGRPASATRSPSRRSATTSPPCTASCRRSSRGSRPTIATCATSSSRSSRTSSGCCRRASASAPGGPRCAWRSRWSTTRRSG